MKYRCEATSLEGFVQQVAANYLPHGYWFWLSGVVPPKKDPRLVDQNLLAKYGVNVSRMQRFRRKLTGLGNLHYIRLGRTWLMLGSYGEHPFYQEHTRVDVDRRTGEEKIEELFRDVRKSPIQIGGYSIWVKKGDFLKALPDEPAMLDSKMRVRVLIARKRYYELKAYFLGIACHRSVENLSREFWNVPFEPYAPVRKQLLKILRMVNARREAAGYEKVPATALRLRRRIVKPFGVAPKQVAA